MDRIELQFLAKRGLKRLGIPVAIVIIVVFALVAVGGILMYFAASNEAKSYSENPYANAAISNSEYVVTYVDAMGCIGLEDKEALEACDHGSNQSSTMIKMNNQVLTIDGKEYVVKNRDQLNGALLKSDIGKMNVATLSLTEDSTDDDATKFTFKDSDDNMLTVTITRNKGENIAIKSMETNLHE